MSDADRLLYRKFNILISVVIAAGAVLVLTGVIGFILVHGQFSRLSQQVRTLSAEVEQLDQADRSLARQVQRNAHAGTQPAATQSGPAWTIDQAVADLAAGQGWPDPWQGRLAAAQTAGDISAEQMVRLSQALLGHHPSAAMDWAEAALAQGGDEPLRPRALLLAGLALEATGEPESALERVLDAIETDGELVEARQAAARLAWSLERLRLAAEQFQAVAELRADSVADWMRAGWAWRSLGEHGLALSAFEQALAINPAEPVAAEFVAADALEAGQPGRTLEVASVAAEVNPTAGLLAVIGGAHHQRGAIDSAIAAWRQALESDPQRPGLWVQLGVVHAQRLDNAEAAQAFQKALAAEADRDDAWYYLAVVQANMQQMDEAVASASRAAELNPHRPDAPYLLAILHARQGNLEAALTALERALQLDGEYASAARASEDFAELIEADARFAALIDRFSRSQSP